jgi:hypothetical protein
MPFAAPRTASSMFASAKTMFALLPPSSIVTLATRSAAVRRMPLPTSVDPVNAIFATPGCSTSAWPAIEPLPGTTLSTPSGRPPSRTRRAGSADSGVNSAGLSTTVLPAASAGATFHDASSSGKFQATIAPTTPSGSRRV